MAGTLANYIPELTRADPRHFGIALVTADGHQYAVGDVDVAFTIQSVSKAFTYGMALDHCGPATVEKHVGVEPSGEAFNSISLEAGTGRPRNPMINAGAIAVTGLVPDLPDEPRFDHILDTFSRYAGRGLDWDREVFASESATGFRNRAIANLLRASEVIPDPVDEVVEDYFRQCAILVDCVDLATMAATLANGGTNPSTGDRVLEPGHVEKVLSVMSTCGMYDYSGTWTYEVGLPAKSGVGGGVIGVLPGQFGVAMFSPLLDVNGNSVRGVAACRDLSRVFDLHLLRAPSMSAHAIRRTYLLSEVASTRGRPAVDEAILAEHGNEVVVIELQGDLFATCLERLVREVDERIARAHTFVVDLRRTGTWDQSTTGLLRGVAADVRTAGARLVVADPGGTVGESTFDGLDVTVAPSLDEALLACEEDLLAASGRPDPAAARFAVDEFSLTRALDPDGRARLQEALTTRSWSPGEDIVVQDDEADALFLLAEGVARVSYADPATGLETRIADLYPGVVFGELSVVGRDRRSATVRARTPVRCHVLERPRLDALREEAPRVYTQVLEHLLLSSSDRLRRANREAASLRA
nr:glutaminase A [Salsipaludibacter albus]